MGCLAIFIEKRKIKSFWKSCVQDTNFFLDGNPSLPPKKVFIFSTLTPI